MNAVSVFFRVFRAHLVFWTDHEEHEGVQASLAVADSVCSVASVVLCAFASLREAAL